MTVHSGLGVYAMVDANVTSQASHRIRVVQVLDVFSNHSSTLRMI